MAICTVNVDFDYRKLSMIQNLDRALDKTIFEPIDRGVMYEADVAHVMMRALRAGDIAVDVGANIGFFSVLMGAAVAPGGRVIAFEPEAANLDRLRANIAASKLANIEIICQPASDCAGQARLYLNSDSSGGHALWDPGAFPKNARSQAQRRVVEMTATTLDRELLRLGVSAPRLIKIDTEGAERRVLAGTVELLRAHVVPYIVAELHEFGLLQLGSSQEDLRRFMEGFGYSTFALFYDGSLPKLIPPQTRLESPNFLNLLFSTIEDVGQLWHSERFQAMVTRVVP